MLIVKALAADGPAVGAGLLTTTLGVPAVAISAAGIVTVILPALVEEGMSPLSEPKSTVAPLTKLEPLMVKGEDAPPAVRLLGRRLLMTGMGLLFVNEKFAEVAAGVLATTL